MSAFDLRYLVGRLLVRLAALHPGVGGWKWVTHRQRAAASVDWPLAEVMIEKSSIERNEHSDGGVSWTLRVNFSYRTPAGPRWYDGAYTEELGCKTDAEIQLLSLRERQLYARYNPSEPSEYFMDPYRDIFKDPRPSGRILKY